MSIKMITLVRDHADKSNARKFLTLLAMADYANEEGIAWPSTESVAEWIGASDKQARRYLREFVDEEILLVVRRGGGTYTDMMGNVRGIPNRYQFNVPALLDQSIPSHAREGTDSPSHEAPDTLPSSDDTLPSSDGTLPPMGENPSVNPSVEPSADPSSSRPSRERQNEIRKAVEIHFSEITQLDRPKTDTIKQRKAAGSRWWNPIREICDLVDWNEDNALALTSAAVSLMDQDGLTISAPASILEVARDAVAKAKRGINPLLGSNSKHARTMSAFEQVRRQLSQ